MAVYGAGKPPLKEDMTPVPEDPYGIAKYAVEMELKVSHEMFGLNYVIFTARVIIQAVKLFSNVPQKCRNSIYPVRLGAGNRNTIDQQIYA